MNKVITIITYLHIVLTSHLAQAQSIADITWVTDSYAPYNYIENGENKDSTVNILKLITDEYVSNINNKIKHKPWPQAYNEALTHENIGIFSLIKTPERENLFHWVGPVGVSQVHIITHKESRINKEDLQHLIYGVIKNDIGHQLIKKEFNKPKLKVANNLSELIQTLNTNQVDAIAYEFNVFKHNIKKRKDLKHTYKSLQKLSSTPMYIGISKQTDPKIVKALQLNLNKLKGIHPQ